ncbi:MAG: S8 family serine peptidase [Candidatus Limnocylindria bacterium]
MVRRLLVILAALSLLMPAGALARDPETTRDLTSARSLDDLRLDNPVVDASPDRPASTLDPALRVAVGPQRVVVELSAAPVADVAAAGQDAGAQRAQAATVKAQQRDLVARARGLDRQAAVVADVQVSLNAVAMTVDASVLEQLAADPAVVSINPVIDYELDLSETVDYVGATAVQDAGFTGAGVRVAVLDSGIDYLHAALGGSGDPADFAANDPAIIESGTFPTPKVVGGYDFVGSAWIGSTGPAEAPDPDPLDDGAGGGHGTHVAHIIAGIGGVAPDASLYAVKVCSSISTSCSGLALLNGMEFATDPNGDGDTSDRVDIINMSLGSPYGQVHDDDLSQAVENASAIGILTVASAGNSSDKPYVTGAPAAAPSALSVAQTHVPSDTQPLMEVLTPAAIAGEYGAVFQAWSRPLEETGVITGTLRYGDGAGGNLNGCAAFTPGSLTGFIVLVDRGACDFSLKIANVAGGGGVVGIIGMVAPGEPFSGGLGACPSGLCETIPGFMISQADANMLKANLGAGVTIRFDPARGLPLIGHVVGSSSRGPTMGDNRVKPEIGAPGASISAIAGTGTDEGPFGGTSGAAPMVSGAAALLMQAYPNRAPAEIKSVLVNTGETEIMNELAFFGGYLAPISRIGGGELRVDRALGSPAAAWDEEYLTGVVSFGFHDVTKNVTHLNRTIVVRNYSGSRVTYNITAGFRFDDDLANGAVSVQVPQRVTVPANATRKVQVKLRIDGSRLRPWMMNSGSQGANPDLLTLMEYDGYVNFDNAATSADDADPMHVAWHVLPRLSGDVKGSDSVKIGKKIGDFGVRVGTSRLRNAGVGPAYIDGYSLVATSPDLPEGGIGEQSPITDIRAVGVQTYPVGAGDCSDDPSFILAIAINTWERQTHANAPNLFFVDLDVDGDGVYDYEVYNLDVAGSTLADGRNLTWVYDFAADAASAFFFTDHGTNGGNTVLLLCGEQIGMNASDFGTPITADAFALDLYFSGNVTDVVEGIQFAPLGERYFPVFGTDGYGSGDIAPNGSTTMTVHDFGSAGTNPSETGIMLVLDAARGGGVKGGAPATNEVKLITVRP